jgi:hypothetical protein
MSGVKKSSRLHRLRLIHNKTCPVCNKKYKISTFKLSRIIHATFSYYYCDHCRYQVRFANNILLSIYSDINISPGGYCRNLISYPVILPDNETRIDIIDDAEDETIVLDAIDEKDFCLSIHLKYRNKILDNLILE